jgi:shikimate dehydrogenase
MDRYAVAGNPVEHSQSPYIHAAFAAQTGQALVYERVLWPLDGFAAGVRALAHGGARGCNVTVPFKFEAFGCAARRSARAQLAQAANVLCFDAQGWLADNTDGAGLVRDIEHNAGVAVAGRRVLLIGAGGAAAGVLGPLLQRRPAELVVVNRSPAKAVQLVERHAALVGHAPLRACALDACGGGFEIVINATASSLGGSGVPVAGSVLARGALALDLMYGAPARPFLDWARAHDAHGRDGLGMLVEQAAEAFELWRGVRPDTAPVLRGLRRRLNVPDPRP